MADSVKRGFPLAKSTRFVPLVALRSVTSKSGLGVYASSDSKYKGVVFGRDSLEVAEDLLNTNRMLVRRILLSLARLQGETYEQLNEEEPGKIVHEYRRRSIDGRIVSGESLQIFNDLSKRWGGTDQELTYYGSIDATPHFVRVIGRYVHRYGEKILHERIVLRSGYQVTMKIIVENAVTWLCRHLEQSQSGLVEFQRRNQNGILNQAWKDSDEFYVHVNGKPANHDSPIASIEVQALAYDALQVAASLFARHEKYLRLARQLRDRTIELLWMPENQYFALGTDFDAQGKLRIIRTATANPAALLDSYFFYDLTASKREQYVSGIVRTITGNDFLTDAGIRSRSLSAGKLVPFWDYHGSYVTWPKETYDIAKGLRRQGFRQLAQELENRVLNITLKQQAYPEFVYVDETGKVLFSNDSGRRTEKVKAIDGVNEPGKVQASTVSAILAIFANRLAEKIGRSGARVPGTWQIQLENELLNIIPRFRPLISRSSLRKRYPDYAYQLGSNPGS